MNAHLSRVGRMIHVVSDHTGITMCGVVTGTEWTDVPLHLEISCERCAEALYDLRKGARKLERKVETIDGDQGGGSSLQSIMAGGESPLASNSAADVRERFRDLEDTRARDDALIESFGGPAQHHPRAHVLASIKVIPAEQAASEFVKVHGNPQGGFVALWTPEGADYPSDVGLGGDVENAVWDLLQRRLKKIAGAKEDLRGRIERGDRDKVRQLRG